MDLGLKLQRTRDAKGLKQEAVAIKSGLSRKHISAVETGVADPSFSALKAILRAMDTSLAQFFESRIPAIYANPDHAEIHENLQEILEGPDKSKIQCMQTLIATCHDAALETQRKLILQEKKHRSG